MIYMFSEYLFPFFLVSIFGWSDLYLTPKLNYTDYFKIAICAMMIIISFFFLHCLYATPKSPIFKVVKYDERTILIIFIIIFLISSAGYFDGLAGYRYSDKGISESGAGAILFAAVYSLNSLIFIYIIFFDYEVLVKNRINNYLIRILGIINCILSINGLLSALISVGITLVYISPQNLSILLNASIEEKNISIVNYKKYFTSITLLLCILPLLLTIGESVKIGKNVDLESLINTYAVDGYILNRSSPSLQSFYIMIGDNQSTDMNDACIICKPLETFKYRFDVITGNNFSLQKPYRSTISLYNLDIISNYNHNEREGTSPGLLASFFLAFQDSNSYIAMLIFLVSIGIIFIPILNSATSKPKMLTAYAFTVLILSVIFSSPLDLLIIIDNQFMIFIIIVYFRIFRLVKVENLKEKELAVL